MGIEGIYLEDFTIIQHSHIALLLLCESTSMKRIIKNISSTTFVHRD